MDDVFADKDFVLDLGDETFSITPEYDDVVEIRTVAYIFVFAHAGTNEAIHSVYVEFYVSQGNLRRFHPVEYAKFCFAFTALSVFFTDSFEPGNGIVREVPQMMSYFFDFFFQRGHLLVGFLYIEAGDTAHRLIDEFFIIVG